MLHQTLVRAVFITFLLSLFCVFGSQAMAAAPPPEEEAEGHLAITEVAVDYGTSSMVIIGDDFDFGPGPLVVILGGTDISANCALDLPLTEPQSISCEGLNLPIAADLLLIVATGSGQSQTDGYDLTFGAVGPQGEQGVQGKLGDTGPQGVQGKLGDTGPQGVQGKLGDTGPQGVQGKLGDTGPQGVQGKLGDTGPQGGQGVQGKLGDTGAQGVQGKLGPQGDPGLSGYEILSEQINCNQNTFPAGSAQVFCPGGKKIIGGGVQMADNCLTYSGYPQANADAFTVSVFRIAGCNQEICFNTVTAYAVCAFVN